MPIIKVDVHAPIFYFPKYIGPKYTGSKYRVTPLTPIRDDETLRIVSVGTVGNSGGDLKVVNS
jgi:hypothetical protein